MKRGFTQTLMMMAVLAMAAQVMAMAPIIKDIPSPIVGDKDTISPVNTFVYRDAIDLKDWVTDTETTDSTKISWYYRIEGSGAHNYSINNSTEVDDADEANFALGAQAINAVDHNKIIAGPGNVNRDPIGDQNPGSTKITIRNKALSPIGGPNHAATGEDAEIVTLYASDGDTVTASKPIYFYTHANENSHMSGDAVPVDIIHVLPTTGTPGDIPGGFSYHAGPGDLGVSISSQGICMSVGTQFVDELGYWESPFSDISLVPNAAYRIRLVLNGTQTQKNQVPVWDVVIQNLKVDAGWDPANPDFSKIHGKQCYGADFYMFDNMGGENAYVQLVKGDAIYDFWWTPPAVQTYRWNDTSASSPGVYSTAAKADDKDALVWFRILNSKVSRGADNDLHAARAVGSLCLKSLEVGHVDIDSLATDPTPVWKTGTDWSQANWAPDPPVGGAWHNMTNNHGSITSLSDGLLLKTGATDSTGDCYTNIAPGDYKRDLSTASVNTDNFPCVMEAKTLYKVTYKLSAPQQADQDNPMDVYWLSCEMMTDEELFESYMTNMAYAHGMPSFKVKALDGSALPDGTPQPFIFLFYSNYGTNCDGNAATAGWWSAFAPHFAFSNNHNFTGGSLATRGGAIKLSEVKVEKVITTGLQ